MAVKAVFFDKDGTLIENVPYNVDPEKIVLGKGGAEALLLLRESFQFHVVSNQAGVALGYFEEKDLVPVKERLALLFASSGAHLADFHYCPHHPEATCACRKPGTLLFQRAAQKYAIDLSQSWMIGDILDDIEAGRRAGCRTIFLDVGNETEWVMNDWRIPHFKAHDLSEAARIILSHEGN